MGKKCVPGVFCIENMTLFIIMVLLLVISYFYYIQFVKFNNNNNEAKIIVVAPPTNQTTTLATISSRSDPFNDPYSPPLKNNGYYFPRDIGGDIRGIPINIQSRGFSTDYQQVGILTRDNNQKSQDMILPLMGRRLPSGRDKWQYYSISNTGNLNTKLPVSVNGKSCTGEYGCDNINNGETIYVEGYNDTFRATIYENNLFNYIPV